MAANNNTTSLNMGGTIGTRAFRDMTARGISTEISRNNYEQNMLSDQRLNAIRQAVYKMVSSWAMEDKIAILTEYGDVDRIGKNASEKVVNAQVTETLIVHLDPADLNQLYKDVGVRERKLMGDVKAIQKKHTAPKGHRFNMGSFESLARKIKFLKPDQVQKAIKAYDDSYKINKNLVRRFKNLEKELRDVLATCFSKHEITGMAISMGLEIMDGQDLPSISSMIINKVILFVSFVLGNSKANYANAFTDMEPYANLLQYTSYSYVVGKPGMDPGAWARLKVEARRAKVAMKERAKMQSYKLHASQTGGGAASALTMGGLARAIKKRDTGVLADADYEQILELAGKYGIDPTKKNTYRLKAEIYAAMGAENKRVASLNRQRSKLAGKGASTRAVDDILSVHASYRDGKLLKGAGDSLSSGVPVVSFDNSGNITTASISKAVPVWIVGQGLPGRSSTPGNPLFRDPALNMLGSKGVKNAPTSEKDLSEEDMQLYRAYLSKKDTDLVGELNGIKGVNSEASTNIWFAYEHNEDMYKNALIWAICRLTKKRTLANFLEKKYGFKGIRLRTNWTVIKSGVWSFLKAPFTPLVKAGKAITRIARRLGMGKITSLDDLSPAAQQVYDSLERLKLDDLVNLIQRLTKKNAWLAMNDYRSTLSARDPKEQEAICSLLAKVVYAHLKGLRDLKSYYVNLFSKFKMEFSKAELAARIRDFVGEIRGSNVHGLKTAIKNAFSPHKIKEQTPEDADATNADARLGIPRIALTPAGLLDGIVTDVVPVWVIGNGMPKKATLKGGIGENAERAARYNKTDSGNNTVTLTKDGKDIKKEMKAKGYKPTSKALKGPLKYGKAGKAYRLSTKDLKWAEDNNFAFATGGQSIIVGDSLTNKPNPERVTIKGDGSFTVNPLKAGPQNGYSDYSLDRYATGGESDDDKSPFGAKYIDPKFSSVIRSVRKSAKADPVYVVNKSLSGDVLASLTGNIVDNLVGVGSKLNLKLSEIETSLASFVLAAPMGVGAMTNPTAAVMGAKGMIEEMANTAMGNAAKTLSRSLGLFNTGGTSKLATGGQSIITGDASGSNIFKGGARPELVSSNGDLQVTPLNKASSNTKVSRLSSEDRRNALAVSIASHVVKYAYRLPQDAQDVSNEGEAIKVFSVKPGITDVISVAGEETTLADMVNGMASQLAALTALISADTDILTKIAAKPSAVISGGQSGNTASTGSFPNSIDNILRGE